MFFCNQILKKDGENNMKLNKTVIAKAFAAALVAGVVFGNADTRGFYPVMAADSVSGSNAKVTTNPGISRFTTSFGMDMTVSSDAGSLEKLGGVDAGKYAELHIDGSISDAAMEMMKAVADEKGAKIANVMEISILSMNSNGSPAGYVDELSDEIKFTIKAPDKIDGNKYSFSVLRLHAGNVDVLSDIDDNPSTITFMTDKFSAYAVVYSENAIEGQQTAANRAPKTADANLTIWISLVVMLFGTGIVWFALGGIERINGKREE